ncbi:hypothetical protein BDQ17DRAFT_1431876 [Cyathus striatus]|nr:hypothetical protein BDQ17DRAFT_1431876 [Cyathus striatus]
MSVGDVITKPPKYTPPTNLYFQVIKRNHKENVSYVLFIFLLYDAYFSRAAWGYEAVWRNTVQMLVKNPVAKTVDLHWFSSVPAFTPTGTPFGLPWAQGQVDRTTPFTLQDQSGDGVPLQSWPLTYLPDSSLKSTGQALSADAVLASALHLNGYTYGA